jgi:intracellular septation protein A
VVSALSKKYWLYYLSMGLMCALAGEGAILFGAVGLTLREDGFYGWTMRPMVVHVLASNILLGSIEPLKHNVS